MRFRLKRPCNDAECTEVKRQEPKRSKIRNFGASLLVSGLMVFGGCGKSDKPVDAPPDMNVQPRQPVGQVHELAKKLLILTRDKFRDALNDYINAKKEEGYEVKIVSLEEIPHTGRDVPESIRDYLMQEKENNRLDYLLIVGDTDHDDFADGVLDQIVDKDWEIPMRYVSVEGKPYSERENEYQDLEGKYDTIFPTDNYYANFSGTWDNDGDGIFGEAGAMNDEFDFKADVYVGRWPVQTEEELRVIITTTLEKEVPEIPVYSIFDGKYCTPYYSDEERERTLDGTVRGSLPEVRDVKVHVCYGDEGGDMAYYINEDNADIVKSVSHGWLHGIVTYGYEGAHYGYDFNYSSEGIDKPPIYLAYACYVGAIDRNGNPADDEMNDVFAERKLKDGSLAAIIAATASHADEMFDFLNDAYLEYHYNVGEALFEYKERNYYEGNLSDKEKGNYLMFNLFGDPTMQISKKPKVRLTIPKAIENHTYYPDVPVFLNAESAMNVRVTYLIASTELEVFNGYVRGTASFTFEHHLDSDLERYLDTSLVTDNDADGIVSVNRITFYSNHVIKGPMEIKAYGGEETTIPVLVLYGNDESVTVDAEFYEGCYECSEREHSTIFSGTFDLSGARKLPITFTMPEKTEGSGTYYSPYVEVSCEGCSSDNGVTFIYYKD